MFTIKIPIYIEGLPWDLRSSVPSVVPRLHQLARTGDDLSALEELIGKKANIEALAKERNRFVGGEMRS